MKDKIIPQKHKVKVFLKQKKKEAAAGRKMFNSILKENKKDKLLRNQKIAYIVFPTDDQEINFYGLLYLNDLIDFYGYDSFVLLTNQNLVKSAASLLCEKTSKVCSLTDSEMKSIIAYYELLRFSHDVYFVSVDIPNERRGSNILGRNGLTKEEFVGIGIYHLLPFRKVQANITYNGEDSELKSFLNIGLKK